MSKVCIGQIVNVHGIKGMVKIRPYLENPMSIGSFGPLTDNKGFSYEVQANSRKGEFVLASVKGITDRTMAEHLKGINLYIERTQLPKPKTGYYYCDLLGMRVLRDGKAFGTVEAVQNFGAGDILDVKTMQGRLFSFDFSKATFPRIDVEKREMDIVIPEGMQEVVNEG